MKFRRNDESYIILEIFLLSCYLLSSELLISRNYARNVLVPKVQLVILICRSVGFGVVFICGHTTFSAAVCARIMLVYSSEKHDGEGVVPEAEYLRRHESRPQAHASHLNCR